jgi:hypothetical protein
MYTPQNRTCAKNLTKSNPSYVFKAYVGDLIYMHGKILWKHNLNIFHIHFTNSVGGSVKSNICSYNFLIYFAVKILILTRWKESISQETWNCSYKSNLKVTFCFGTYQWCNQITTMNVIDLWKIHKYIFENSAWLLFGRKLIRLPPKQHDLLPCNYIYCQHMSLVLEAKFEKNSTLKYKVSILAIQHFL